jgi:hypothetical protein
MNNTEFNIPNIPLYEHTEEDIILKSPLRIPPKGLQDLITLEGIKNTKYAYYDLNNTENQLINISKNVNTYMYGNIRGYTNIEGNTYMGGDIIGI